MQVKSKSTSQYLSQQLQNKPCKSKRIALVIGLVGALVSGSAFAQNDSAFTVENLKNKKFPAAEASRIYEAVCVVVAREVRPEHPPLLQPRFRLVLGADKDELVQHNDIAELRLESWDREKFAQGVVILAAREILKANNVSQLSRRALAWTDAVVPLADLADAR